MKILTLLSTLLILGTSLCFAGEPRHISSAEARALLAQNRRLLVVDVRTREEYQRGHLAGAQLIPLAELERRVQELPRERGVLLYCAVGQRSGHAAAFLAKQGFSGLYNMKDGLVGWYKNGFPVEK